MKRTGGFYAAARKTAAAPGAVSQEAAALRLGHLAGTGMIGIVRIALQRPYTFVVMALLILIVGPLVALRMPTDIFPDIKVPVIGVAWTYTGLPPDEMAGRIITPYERILTTTVNDVEHVESTSLPGMRGSFCCER